MRGEELIEPWNMAVLLVCGVLGVYLALGFLHGWLIRGQQGLQAAPHPQHWCAAASLPQPLQHLTSLTAHVLVSRMELWGLVKDGAAYSVSVIAGEPPPRADYGRVPDGESDGRRKSSGRRKDKGSKKGRR